MPVTIREIAEKAGVSRGTVDRVLNGRQRVKPEVRERVLAIARELNYVPNVAGKALAYSKNPIRLGIVMPPEEIRFFDEIRSGIREAAEELKDMGVRLDYRYVDNEAPQEAAQAIGELVRERVNGILLAVMDDPLVRESIDRAAEQGVPVMTFNSDVEDCRRLCFIGQDLYKSGRVAGDLMGKVLGERDKVAVVTGSLKFHAHRSRVRGFADYMAEHKRSLRIVRTIEGFDRYADTYAQLNDTLEQHPDLKGIYMAAGLVGACLDAVRRHGRERVIRIVCNDILPEIEQGMRERLIDFTIVQNPRQQGYRALRLMYDCAFAGRRPEQEYHFTETHIFTPESL